jgi:hypothetical protein
VQLPAERGAHGRDVRIGAHGGERRRRVVDRRLAVEGERALGAEAELVALDEQEVAERLAHPAGEHHHVEQQRGAHRHAEHASSVRRGAEERGAGEEAAASPWALRPEQASGGVRASRRARDSRRHAQRSEGAPPAKAATPGVTEGDGSGVR